MCIFINMKFINNVYVIRERSLLPLDSIVCLMIES